MENILSLMPQVLEGALMTLKVFVITIALSIPLGIVVALGRLSKSKIISKITEGYILIMRGTPLLLQLFFVFFGLPYLNISIDRFPSAILAFVLNYGAYFGEIFRGGIQSIDDGQYEAGEVLGLSRQEVFFRIILPQAFKRVVAPVGNEIITLIKDTSLVYVVGLDELLKVGKIAVSREASIVPFFVVGLVYLIIIAILTKIMNIIERKYDYYK